MFESLRKKSLAEKVLYCMVSILFLLVSLSYLYIVFWTIMSSLKTHTEVIMKPFAFPEVIQWGNYLELATVFQYNGHTFLEMLFNSVWFSVGGAFIEQFTTCMFAYACTKYEFPGSKYVYTIILIMMTLPLYGNGGALYRLLYGMGLTDTYLHVLISAGGMSVNFLYYRAFILNLSWTYAEAAQMDGANHFQIYFKVMFPMLKPIFAALFITAWLKAWNNFESAMIYLPNLPTLPVGIYQFNTEMIYRARLDVLFAACLIVSIPAFVIFGVFNKTLTENVSLGGIKG